jgi:hypothetical protein
MDKRKHVPSEYDQRLMKQWLGLGRDESLPEWLAKCVGEATYTLYNTTSAVRELDDDTLAVLMYVAKRLLWITNALEKAGIELAEFDPAWDAKPARSEPRPEGSGPMPLDETADMSLDKVPYPQLKQMAADAGLSGKGTREELIARLEEARLQPAGADG